MAPSGRTFSEKVVDLYHWGLIIRTRKVVQVLDCSRLALLMVLAVQRGQTLRFSLLKTQNVLQRLSLLSPEYVRIQLCMFCLLAGIVPC